MRIFAGTRKPHGPLETIFARSVLPDRNKPQCPRRSLQAACGVVLETLVMIMTIIMMITFITTIMTDDAGCEAAV